LSGKLGLARKVQKGDKVCVLYGCTVPVILKRYEKRGGDLEAENFEDQIEALRSCIVKMEERRARKLNPRERLESYTCEERIQLRTAKDRANYCLETERLVRKATKKAKYMVYFF